MTNHGTDHHNLKGVQRSFLYALIHGVLVSFAMAAAVDVCAQPFINEFSNGTSGTKEFYELVVDGPPGGFQDIRGWIVDDHSGFFGCASGNGIASGHLRFANIPNWECVKVGSIILVYNPADVNSAINIPDDYSDANNDYVYVLPVNAAGMFAISTSHPSSSNCNNFSGTLAPSGSGTTWNCIALGNGADAVVVADPSNLGAAYHAISYGSVNGPFAPIHFSGSGAGTNYSFVHTGGDDYMLQVNWASGSASTFDTPGAPNNNANALWLASLRVQLAVDTNAGCPPFQAVAQMLNADSSLVLSWDFGDGTPVVQGNGVSHLYQVSGTYQMYVTVSNDSGCSYTDSVLFTVGAPNLLFPALPGVCAGDPPFTLVATPAGGTFFGNGVNGTQFSPAVAGTGTHLIGYAYTQGNCSDTLYQPVNITPPPAAAITLADTGYLCEGDSVLLTATGTGPFLWSTGNNTATLTVTSSGTYSVSASNVCGTAQDSRTLLFHSLPKAVISSDDDLSICDGEQVELTANGGETYLWSTGAQSQNIVTGTTGSYSVTASNECGSDVATMEVSPAEDEPFELRATKTALCPGASSVITLAGEFSGIQWSQGSTGASITVTAPGIYSVSFTGSCREQYASIHITALPAPAVDIFPAGPVGICPGDAVVLSAFHRGELRWNTGSRRDSIQVLQPRIYHAESRNSCGVTYDSVEVYEYDLPAVKIDRYSEKAYAPAEVHFGARTGEECEIVHWSVGGSVVQKGGESLLYYFPEVGVDTVTVSATDVHGCFVSHSIGVEISELVAMYVPNAFTPDGDGVNDWFEIKGTGVYDPRLQVYDRWGRLVKTIEDDLEHMKWDGTCGADKCQEGVYSYSLEYTTVSGERLFETGLITIIP